MQASTAVATVAYRSRIVHKSWAILAKSERVNSPRWRGF